MSDDRRVPRVPEMPPTTVRRILLADCDAMFVAVARIVDPDGAGKAPYLIVGGRPEGRGVVSSASYEVRAFGIRNGMPTARALRLCPEATVVPVPRDAVVAMNRRIRAILSEYAVVLDPASIDEFYLDVTGTEGVFGEDLGALAHRIRARVLEETGISLSIGGATNRLVAKLAASRAKPGGVRIVPPGEEAAFLRGFDLPELPGIGPRTAERLARFGLRTVADALRYPADALASWFGERGGRRLYDRIRGIDPTPVLPPGPPKSHSREETFPADIHDDEALDRELLALVVRVAIDLADDGRLARTVTVKVRDPDFRTRLASHTPRVPMTSERQIFAEARALLRRLRKQRREGVRLLGVALSNLVEPAEWGDGAQLGLFDPPGEAAAAVRERRLVRALDTLRKRFGPDTVQPAALLDRDSS
ncbi:MAG TPA: DNA polymerase IV [Longimicrobiales bacterium]